MRSHLAYRGKERKMILGIIIGFIIGVNAGIIVAAFLYTAKKGER